MHINTHASLTYSIFVSRYGAQIAFTIAALKNLDVWACDIGNSYLNTKYRENLWKKAGTKFVNDKGKVVIVIRAVFGWKSNGAAW